MTIYIDSRPQRSITARLGKTSRDLEGVTRQLASGKRIVKTSDDAAGQAVVTSLSTKKRIGRVTKFNVNQAAQLINTINSGLEAQKQIVARMSEIALAGSTSTLTDTQRQVLDAEYGALLEEYDRVANSTTFNGLKPLRANKINGTPAKITIDEMATDDGQGALSIEFLNNHRYAGTLVQKSDLNESGGINLTDRTLQYNLISGSTSASSSEVAEWNTAEQQDVAQIAFTAEAGGEVRNGIFTFTISRLLGDNGRTSKYSGGSPTVTEAAAAQRLVGFMVLEGSEASNDRTASIETIITAGAGGVDSSVTVANGGAALWTGALSSYEIDNAVTLDFSSMTFASYDYPSAEYTPTSIGFTHVRNRYSASRAATTLRNRMSELTQAQGRYGAVLNRLERADMVLSVGGDELAMAVGRIQDADIASKSAEFVRLKILQDKSGAMLEQANQAPQMALMLLG